MLLIPHWTILLPRVFNWFLQLLGMVCLTVAGTICAVAGAHIATFIFILVGFILFKAGVRAEINFER
jgi:hypothetical protein